MHQVCQHAQAASATSQPTQSHRRLEVLCTAPPPPSSCGLTFQPAAQPLRLAAARSLLRHAVRRERPRLRRRAITRRPPLVRRRCKNPCRFLRTRLLGW